jgi:hypothetical protein
VNLQSAIDYGLFVQFVANTWNTGSKANNLDGKKVTNTDNSPIIAGKSYTVTRTIYANDLSTDINPTTPGTNNRVTMAILAQNDADPNDVVIAIRGTLDIWEWIQDAKFLLRDFPRVAGSGYTEDGFTDMYLSFSINPATAPADIQADAGDTFFAALTALIPTTASVTVAGHSLGSALATLMAFDLAANTKLPVTLYTLASPRVGDHSFSTVFNHTVPDAYRIANRLDVVPKVPPPLMYFHVGDETELIPPPQLKFDLACEHHLTSYFNMLENLISPTSTQYPIQPDCLKSSTPTTNATED